MSLSLSTPFEADRAHIETLKVKKIGQELGQELGQLFLERGRIH
jgi:hypothetical protein